MDDRTARAPALASRCPAAPAGPRPSALHCAPLLPPRPGPRRRRLRQPRQPPPGEAATPVRVVGVSRRREVRPVRAIEVRPPEPPDDGDHSARRPGPPAAPGPTRKRDSPTRPRPSGRLGRPRAARERPAIRRREPRRPRAPSGGDEYSTAAGPEARRLRARLARVGPPALGAQDPTRPPPHRTPRRRPWRPGFGRPGLGRTGPSPAAPSTRREGNSDPGVEPKQTLAGAGPHPSLRHFASRRGSQRPSLPLGPPFLKTSLRVPGEMSPLHSAPSGREGESDGAAPRTTSPVKVVGGRAQPSRGSPAYASHWDTLVSLGTLVSGCDCPATSGREGKTSGPLYLEDGDRSDAPVLTRGNRRVGSAGSPLFYPKAGRVGVLRVINEGNKDKVLTQFQLRLAPHWCTVGTHIRTCTHTVRTNS